MVSDQQVKRLWRLAGQKLSLEIASARRAWTRRQRGNTCNIDACRARCDRSIRGEHDQIRSPTAGKRFGNYSLSSQACRPRHSLSISSRCIQGDSVTDRYGRATPDQLLAGNGSTADWK